MDTNHLKSKKIICLFLAYVMFSIGGIIPVRYVCAETLDTKIVTPKAFFDTPVETRRRLFLEVAGYVMRSSYYISRDEEKKNKFERHSK